MNKKTQLGINASELENLHDSYEKTIKAEESLANREIDYNLENSKDYKNAKYSIDEIEYLLSMKDKDTDIIQMKYIASEKSFYEAKLKGLKKLKI